MSSRTLKEKEQFAASLSVLCRVVQLWRMMSLELNGSSHGIRTEMVRIPWEDDNIYKIADAPILFPLKDVGRVASVSSPSETPLPSSASVLKA